MKPPKSDVCIYCQAQPATTDDHVPPKLIFVPPRPSNLRTVPSCRTCNNSFGPDDEYLRQFLSLRVESDTHPSGKPLTDSAIRGLMRSGPGMEELQRKTRRIPFLQLDGSWGEKVQVQFDSDSLERTAQRIVRGLLFFHQQILIPPDNKPLVIIDFWHTSEKVSEIELKHKQLMAEEPVHKVGGIFDYQFGMTEDQSSTIWRLAFMSDIKFWVMTLPLDHPAQNPK